MKKAVKQVIFPSFIKKCVKNAKRGKPSPWAQPPASSPQPLPLGGKKVYKQKYPSTYRNNSLLPPKTSE